MRGFIVAALIWIVLAPGTLAQVADLVWARQLSGPDSNDANDVVVDGNGDVVLVGGFRGAVDFDPALTTSFLTSTGVFDGFVCKLNAAGDLAWARRIGGTGRVTVKGVTTDSSDDVIVVGDFQGTVDLDPGSPGILTAVGSTDAFVIKLAGGTGTLIWAAQFAGGITAAQDVAVDVSDNVYSVGHFTGSVDFDPGGAIWSLAGVSDAFVSKLTAGGSFEWVRQIGGNAGGGGATGVAVNGADVHVVGSFGGTVDFSPGPPGILTALGPNNAFVVQLDDAGNFNWARQVSAGFASATGVALDGAGNIYEVGVFSGTADFDPLLGPLVQTAAGSGDVFLVKLDAGGGVLWARQFGGAGYDEANGVAADDSGVYVAGLFEGNVDFDPGVATFSLVSTGGGDAFVVRLDVGGDFACAGAMGGPGTDFATVALNGPDVYAVGTFENTADFDPGAATVNLTSAGDIDVYVAKLTCVAPSGCVPDLAWAHALSGADNDEAQSNAVDAAGNVFTVGVFQGTVDFDPAGTFPLTSAGGNDAFISKLDATGNFVWARRIGGAGLDRAFGVAVDGNGDAVVVGRFEGTADFNPGGGGGMLTATASHDAFVAKFTAGGSFDWARRFGPTTSNGFTNEALGVAVDGNGDVYSVGTFQGTVDFDPGAPVFDLVSAGGNDAFVSKLTGAGNFDWAGRIGGAGGGGQALGVAVNGTGVHVVGRFSGTFDFDPGTGITNLSDAGSGDAFVVKLDTAGDFNWAATLGGTDFDRALGVALDGAGNVYTVGSFRGTADFDPGTQTSTLTSAGAGDAFVAKLDSTGGFVWVGQLGGTGDDEATDVALDASGDVYAVGLFEGTADFDPGAGSSTLISAGQSDAFFVKLDASGDFSWASGVGGTGFDWASDLALAGLDVYGTGTFEGTADFDPGSGNVFLTSAGAGEVFVLKLSCPQVCSAAVPAPLCFDALPVLCSALHSEVLSVDHSGEHHWRSIALGQPGTVRIETSTDMPGTATDDTDLLLWGDCDLTTGGGLALLAFNDDSPLANDVFMSRIDSPLIPGTYYVEVGGSFDTATPDCFTLAIDCRPSVSIAGATYRISGLSTGLEYSWGIDSTGDYDPLNPIVGDLEAYNPDAPPFPGVPVGGTPADLAAAFAADISSFPVSSAVFISPDSFDITLPTSPIRLFVGLEGQPPFCEVTSVGCAYNPTITKVACAVTCPEDVTLECPAETDPSNTGVAIATNDCVVASFDTRVEGCGNTETITRVWTATDESGNTDECTQTIAVVDTTPPAVGPPAPTTFECNSLGGIPASDSQAQDWLALADGSDSCGAVTLSSDAPDFFAVGGTIVTLHAVDECGGEASAPSTMTVEDTTPPEISVELTPGFIWPPNHRMVDVEVSVMAADACSTPSVALMSVTSNEADNGVGDGNTINDIQDADLATSDFDFRVRAERAGGGSGRIYTAIYTATDSAGNSGSAAGFVAVPHDQGGITDPLELVLEENGTGTLVRWNDVPGALSFDVIRGQLSNVVETDIAIGLGPVTCVEANSTDVSTAGWEDPDLPDSGRAFFYLVEHDDGTSSSYGTESAAKPRAPGSGDCQ